MASTAGLEDGDLEGYEDERRALERLRSRKAELLKEIDELKAGLSTVSVELDALKSVKAKEEREAVARTEAAAAELNEEERRNLLAIGKKKFNADPQKGIDFLIEKKLLENTSDAVASLFMDSDLFDKRVLGEYLGDGKQFNIDVLTKFVHLQDFTGLVFDKALRKFLALFRLPGEAQKIDRMMERFAMRYHENNPSTFASSDTAYVLAFSLIMLNTDLHNPAIKNKISREAFVRNNRGINNGSDVPERLLLELYETILKEEIRMEEDMTLLTFYNPEREGWLAKQGGRVKSWKRRWFILTGNCLYYFKDPNDTAPCGIIPLENLDILEALPPASTIDRKTKVRFGLQHAAPNKIKAAKTVDGKLVEGRHNEYLFACETEDERNDWIRSLKANMQKKPAYFLMQQKKEKVTNRQQEGAAGVDDSDGE